MSLRGCSTPARSKVGSSPSCAQRSPPRSSASGPRSAARRWLREFAHAPTGRGARGNREVPPCAATRVSRGAAERNRRVSVLTLRAPLLETYARADVTFVSGNGSWLVDDEGRRYLDLVAGIAVVGLGPRHPPPLAAAQAQLDRPWHGSNRLRAEPT